MRNEETVCMECQSLFSSKKNKKNISSTELAQRLVKLKNINQYEKKTHAI